MAECIGKPLYSRELVGSSVNQDLEYIPTENDEIEDLYELLKEILVS